MALPSPSAVPTASELSETMNELNLALAKRNAMFSSMFSSMRRRLQPPKTTSGSKPRAAAGLAAAPCSSSSTTPAPTTSRPDQKPQAVVDAADAKFEVRDDVGLGCVPAAEAARAASRLSGGERDLKKKILGKRAAEQIEEGRKKRGRRGDNSSDEEEGRSALGRAKRNKALLVV